VPTSEDPETVRTARATSFGSVADAYARGRPGYPADAVAWLVGGARDVVDLGAGTGLLTRSLRGPGRRVTAVEPLPGMLDRLRADLPDVTAVAGSAEAIPLPDESVDLVVAGQAFHWFDPARAVPEMARVLRPGGAVGLVWNQRDEGVDWIRSLWQHLPESSEGVDTVHVGAVFATGGDRFGTVESFSSQYEQPLDRAALSDLVRSRSYVATMDPPAREEVMSRIGHLLDTHPDTAGRDLLDMVYVTRAFRIPCLRTGP